MAFIMQIILTHLLENTLNFSTITATAKKLAFGLFLLGSTISSQIQDFAAVKQNIAQITREESLDAKIVDIDIYYNNNSFNPVWIEHGLVNSKALTLLEYIKNKPFMQNSEARYLYDSIIEMKNHQSSPAQLAWIDYSVSYLLTIYAQYHLYGIIDPEHDLKSHYIKAKKIDTSKFLEYCKSQKSANSIISMFNDINSEQKYLENVLIDDKYNLNITYKDKNDKPISLSKEEISNIININLERSKWLPPASLKKYINANIPEFSLNYFSNDGRSISNMKIIAGRTKRKTPIFSDNLSYIELNPTWNVPRKIIREDFKPKLIKNPNALASKNIRIYESWKPDAAEINPSTVSWSNYRYKKIPYRFTQDAGDENSLGKVKLMFPNPYDIYIHGTPEKYLFSRETRAYSSGCIRVEKPELLAANIMNSYRGWSIKRINSALETNDNKVLTPKKKIPVYITYQTAKADKNNNLYIYQDIYDYDKQAISVLKKRNKEYFEAVNKQTNALNIIAIKLISQETTINDLYQAINPFKPTLGR